jgi:hypothetical protein
MEGALDAVPGDLADAECHAAMRTFVAHDSYLSAAIAPGNQLLAYTRYAGYFAFFDLVGFKDGVPLVGDHCSSGR